MSRSLLTTSNIQLFGQKISDILVAPVLKDADATEVNAASQINFALTGHPDPVSVDGVNVAIGGIVILRKQNTKTQNGVYDFQDVAGSNNFVKRTIANGDIFLSVAGDKNRKKYWVYRKPKNRFARFDRYELNFETKELGDNNFLANQLDAANVGFAKIYGFSFEGEYFDLAKPAIYLVHGRGRNFTLNDRRARSPLGPHESGIGAADFQFASDLRVWEYDKADFTVRMDLSGGMFEDVLLDFEIDYEDHPMFGGGKVGGGKVGGGKVGGGKVGGGKVGGGKVGGGKVGGGKVGGG